MGKAAFSIHVALPRVQQRWAALGQGGEFGMGNRIRIIESLRLEKTSKIIKSLPQCPSPAGAGWGLAEVGGQHRNSQSLCSGLEGANSVTATFF